MLVQHLANQTNCEMQIPYGGNLGTSPHNQGILTIGNPKSIAFVVSAGVNITANNFYFQIQEKCFFVRSICFIQLNFSWIYIGHVKQIQGYQL